MEEQGATTLRDVLRNVAGITFQAGEGGVPAGDQLSIRGFSARTDMFVDGVRDFGGYSRDSFNMEQVEVAKGPTSSLAGRGSTGGAINQVSKAPGLQSDRRRDDRRRQRQLPAHDRRRQPAARAIFPCPARRFASTRCGTTPTCRIAIASTSSRWGVAPSIGLGARHPHARDGQLLQAEAGQPARVRPAVGAGQHQPGARGVSPTVRRRSISRTSTAWSARDYEKTDTDLATVDVAHDVGSATVVRNLTRWGRNVRDSVITAPRFVAVNTSTAINRQLQSRDMTDEILANQTNLTTRVVDRRGRVTRSSRGSRCRPRARSTTRASGRLRRPPISINPNPNDPYPGPIVRSGASTDGTAIRRPRMRSTRHPSARTSS